jgi:hypothetical protein
MIKNRYKIIDFVNPSRKLPKPELTIERCGLHFHLNYWNSPPCISRFWRLYWNDSPGAILEFNDVSIVMSPGTMVLIPPYTMSLAHTIAPFIHNFVEFSTGPSFASFRISRSFLNRKNILRGFLPEVPLKTNLWRYM